MLRRSVSVFALMGIGCISAQLPEWQDQYYSGIKALKEGRYADASASLHAAYDRAQTPPAEEEWKARTAFGLGLLAVALRFRE